MPATPVYALPYPLATDSADVPRDLEALAEAVEGAFALPPATTLPASPSDGQVARYKLASSGPVWSFVYLAASAAPYRWHFIGGLPMYARNDANAVAAGTVWPTTYIIPAPTLTPPLVGFYRVAYGMGGVASVGNILGGITTEAGAAGTPITGGNLAKTPPPWTLGAQPTAPAGRYELEIASGGRIAFHHCWAAPGSNGSDWDRWVEVVPIRVS